MKKRVTVGSLITALFAVLVWTFSSSAGVLTGEFTDYGQPTSSGGLIGAMTLGKDGLIYGVTCDAELFTFDPTNVSFSDKGKTPGDCPLALTWGKDGDLYGGGYESTLWSYDPSTALFSSRGQIPGERTIIGLATGEDGTIYVGTQPGTISSQIGRLYSFDPADDSLHEIGGILGASSVGYGLMAGSDGRIYGGTVANGHLFVFDPQTDILTDKGQVLETSGVYRLTEVEDGKIYGSADARLFAYDPETDAIANKGIPVAGQDLITSLQASGNVLYGGTGNGAPDRELPHLFEYHIAKESATDLGVPVKGDEQWVVNSLAIDGEIVYGGTGIAGHFFSYEQEQESKIHIPIVIR